MRPGAAHLLGERLADHPRAEIRAANPDIHDIGDRLPGCPSPCARPHTMNKGFHAIEHVVHVGGDCGAAGRVCRVAWCTQGHVEGGAALGEINGIARELLPQMICDPSRARQRPQGLQALRIHALLGKVQVKADSLETHALDTVRLGSEQLSRPPPAHGLDRRVELRPRSR